MTILDGAISQGAGGSGLAFDAKVAAGSATDAETSQEGIRAAIAAAGVGGTVIFDKDYLIASSFQPLDGQTWSFLGGKFILDDQIHADVTSGTITTSTSAVTVSTGDAANFFVGQGVSVNDSNAASGGIFGAKALEIQAIDLGTGVITFTETVATLFNGSSITTNKRISSACRPIDIRTGIDTVRIINAEVDGNKANFTYAKWSPQRCVSIAGDCINTYMENPRIRNWAGDAFIVGGVGTVIDAPYVDECTGNSYHYSGGDLTLGLTVNNPRALNVQLSVGATEHAHGFLSYSTVTGKSLTVNPQFYGSLKGGIGGISDRTNSVTKITGGYMSGVDNGELLAITAAEAGNALSDIEITGMTIEGYGDANGGDENRITISGPTVVSFTITGITKAGDAVITTSGTHSFVEGDDVTFSGVVGMTEMNGRFGTVVGTPTSTTLTVSTNSTPLTTYTSGGTVSSVTAGNASNVTFTGNTLINCFAEITDVANLIAANDWRWGGTVAQTAVVYYKNISSGIIDDVVRGAQSSYILSGSNWGDVVITSHLYQSETAQIMLDDDNDASTITLRPRVIQDGGLTAVTITTPGTGYVVGNRFTMPIESDAFFGAKVVYDGPVFSAKGRVTRVGSSGEIEAVCLENNGAGYNKQGFGTEPIAIFDTGSGVGGVLTGIRPDGTTSTLAIISTSKWTNLNLTGFELSQHYHSSANAIEIRANNDNWVLKDLVMHMNAAFPLLEPINNLSSATQIINCGANRTPAISATSSSGDIVLDTVTGVDTGTFSAYEIA